MDKNQGWPLETWLKIAVARYGLAPSEFWKMSLVDWFALMCSQRLVPMTQDDLIKMEQDYDSRK